MWLSDRRTFLLSLAALGGCGFTPVYGPDGAGTALQGAIRLRAPDGPGAYRFNQRFEERLGRGTSPTYEMAVNLTVKQVGMGSTSAGSTTRFRVDGTADVALTLIATGEPVLRETITGFTGYSTTGNTAATLAAERDAGARLMVILADQTVDRLLLNADRLAQAAR